ncbi:hypothetical protein RJ639_045820 [Escallonia herrerae]|uniref:Uncharacterized protein n=1 Tax=Escallonia herrerae TaxID=1293975 RepID=A0AA88W7F6_9ASTE|nr:hypothetical protein RJ639_045820 [Escallonia herrerae]
MAKSQVAERTRRRSASKMEQKAHTTTTTTTTNKTGSSKKKKKITAKNDFEEEILVLSSSDSPNDVESEGEEEEEEEEPKQVEDATEDEDLDEEADENVSKRQSNEKTDRKKRNKESVLYTFPMHRVNRMIKGETPDIRITQEAVFLINKASRRLLVNEGDLTFSQLYIYIYNTRRHHPNTNTKLGPAFSGEVQAMVEEGRVLQIIGKRNKDKEEIY